MTPPSTRLGGQRPRPGDPWHVKEVGLTIHNKRHGLWRDVGQDHTARNLLAHRRLNQKVIQQFFRKLPRGLTYVPGVVIMETLQSYGAARHKLLPSMKPPGALQDA